MRLSDSIIWYHQQESNLYLALRRHSFYPLNYGGGSGMVRGTGIVFAANNVVETPVQLKSVISHGKDQIHRALLARLCAQRKALRQVIKNI